MKIIENGLIPVMENQEGNKLVSARELHEFLEIKTKFADWIKARIEKYDFIENQDFTLVSEKKETNNPKNPYTEITEYILTLDTAKEISMVENNEKGKEARKYFINVEKKFKNLRETSINQPNVLISLNAVKFIADDLRVSEVSRIKMYRKACENEGVNSNFLPTYTEEEVAKSATELLKKFEVPMSVIKFNQLMLKSGLLVEKSRGSSKKGTKKYKSLTEDGLKYGINKVSSYGTEQETTPLYHESTFTELVNFLESVKGVG